MPDSVPDGVQIKTNGWRQGSVLGRPLLDYLADRALISWRPAQNDAVIVLSHDCDVVNDSLTAEPSVELLWLKALSLGVKDGHLQWGKNPRRYQFVDPGLEESSLYEVSIHDRVTVPRNYLREFRPDDSRHLQVENLRRLCRWIASRYTRAAFPDAFNARIASLTPRLRSVFKVRGGLITGLYLLITDEELPASEDYRLTLIATMLSSDHEEPSKRASAQELLGQIEAIFAGCRGIELAAADLRSETELSLDDLRRLKRWDFDHLSLRKSSVTVLPPAP